MTDTPVSPWGEHTARARTWFETLRDRICAAFEAIEREAGSDACFTYTAWNRAHDGEPVENGGGGVQGGGVAFALPVGDARMPGPILLPHHPDDRAGLVDQIM